jgi:urease subunit alpha
VLWKPAFFGVKPELVLKGGLIAYAEMGDPGASIPTPEPMLPRPMFAAATPRSTCLTFMSRSALESGLHQRLGLSKRVEAVRNTRGLGKRDMVGNAATPTIEVDPSTYAVYADGVHLTCEPASALPMTQRYFLF